MLTLKIGKSLAWERETGKRLEVFFRIPLVTAASATTRGQAWEPGSGEPTQGVKLRERLGNQDGACMGVHSK